MGEALKARYSLNNAVVIPSNFTDSDLIRSVISQRAADCILSLISENDYSNIAFTWGRTLFDIISQLDIAKNDGLTAVPLVGAGDRTAPYYMINEMVRIAADRLGAAPVYAYIPVHPESREDAMLFKKPQHIEICRRCGMISVLRWLE